MRMIQLQNLQTHDIKTLDSNQLIFHGQLFQLGPKISKKLENAALEYCQICCNSGQACLLQEDDSHWIVWKHVKNLSQTALPSSPPQPDLLPSGPPTLSPQFIEHCQQALATCIGPIAGLVLEQTLSEFGSVSIEPQQLITALSQKIPSESLATQFQADCKAATDVETITTRINTLKLESSQSRPSISHSKAVHSPVSI